MDNDNAYLTINMDNFATEPKSLIFVDLNQAVFLLFIERGGQRICAMIAQENAM